jgi:hypothetical protein
MKRIALFLFLILSVINCFAQTQIDPTYQIQWNSLSGSGSPSISCTQNGNYSVYPYGAEWGQPYQDTTNNVEYKCTTSGWVKNLPTTGGTITGNLDVIGSVVAMDVNGDLNPLTFSGSDIGAKINSSAASLPSSSGTIYLSTPGLYPYSTTINLPPNVMLVCATGAVLQYTGSSDGLLQQPVGGATSISGGVIGCVWQAPTSPAANVNVLHIGDIAGGGVWDVAVYGYTAAGDNAMLVENKYYFFIWNTIKLKSASNTNSLVWSANCQSGYTNCTPFMAYNEVHEFSGGSYGQVSTAFKVINGAQVLRGWTWITADTNTSGSSIFYIDGNSIVDGEFQESDEDDSNNFAGGTAYLATITSGLFSPTWTYLNSTSGGKITGAAAAHYFPVATGTNQANARDSSGLYAPMYSVVYGATTGTSENLVPDSDFINPLIYWPTLTSMTAGPSPAGRNALYYKNSTGSTQTGVSSTAQSAPFTLQAGTYTLSGSLAQSSGSSCSGNLQISAYFNGVYNTINAGRSGYDPSGTFLIVNTNTFTLSSPATGYILVEMYNCTYPAQGYSAYSAIQIEPGNVATAYKRNDWGTVGPGMIPAADIAGGPYLPLSGTPLTGAVTSTSTISSTNIYLATSASVSGWAGGITSVTATTGYTNTSKSGSFTIAGGSFTTGGITTISWAATPAAQSCLVAQNGGTAWYGVTATTAATGISLAVINSIAGATFQVAYFCGSPL